MVRIAEPRHHFSLCRYPQLGLSGWEAKRWKAQPGRLRILRVITLDQRVTEESGIGNVESFPVRCERERERGPARWQALDHRALHRIDHRDPVVGLIQHVEAVSSTRQCHRPEEAVRVTIVVQLDRRRPSSLDQIEGEDYPLVSARRVECSIVRCDRHAHKDRAEFVVIIVRDLLAAIAGTIRLDLHQLGCGIFLPGRICQPGDDRDREWLGSVARCHQRLPIPTQRQPVWMRRHAHLPAARCQ